MSPAQGHTAAEPLELGPKLVCFQVQVLPGPRGSWPWALGGGSGGGRELPLPKTNPVGSSPSPNAQAERRDVSSVSLQSAGPRSHLSPILRGSSRWSPSPTHRGSGRLSPQLNSSGQGNSHQHSLPQGAPSHWGQVRVWKARGRGVASPRLPVLVWPHTEHAYFKILSAFGQVMKN